jgi:hypothetical protein
MTPSIIVVQGHGHTPEKLYFYLFYFGTPPPVFIAGSMMGKIILYLQ